LEREEVVEVKEELPLVVPQSVVTPIRYENPIRQQINFDNVEMNNRVNNLFLI
jgi:hypothetical protein